MITNLNIACVLVRGNVPYTVEYVRRLRSAVVRRLVFPHQFTVLTDEPNRFTGVPGIRVVEIPGVGHLPGWWAKVQLFNPAHFAEGQRVVYLDLDTLPVDSLDPIVGYPSPFALVPHAGNFQGRGRLRVVKNYNSSVMSWVVSPRTCSLYTDWTLDVTNRLWGDQDWIGERVPDADKMPIEWFPRLSEISGPPLPKGAKVILCKRPKNHEAAQQFPWFREMWK